jgi:tetratricopeptide (TPR) repeat protein
VAQEFDTDSLDRTSRSYFPRGLLFLTALSAIVGGMGILWYATSQPKIVVGDNKRSSLDSTDGEGSLASMLTSDDSNQAIAWLQEKHGINNPSEVEIILAAGGLAVAGEEYEKAARYFERVKTEVPRFGMTARLEQGVALLKLNFATPAEQNLSKFLEAARSAENPDPTQVLDGFKWLTFLLSVQIRQEERKLLLEEQHAIDLADPLDSKQLYFPNLLILNSPAGRTRLAKLLENEPTNLSLLVASARYQTLAGEFDEAIENLEKLRRTRLGDLVVAAALAEALVESDRLEDAGILIDSIPPYHSMEPWLLTRMRGELALHREKWNDALKYFGIVLEVDPANAPAQMGMAMSYEKIGDKDNHEEALRRSGVLAKIRVNLGSVQTDAEAACLDLATQCRAIDMEAAAKIFERHAARIKEQTKIGAPATQ